MGSKELTHASMTIFVDVPFPFPMTTVFIGMFCYVFVVIF